MTDPGVAESATAFVARVPTRHADADASGFLAESRIVTLMEEARVAWLLSAGEQYRPLITSAMIVTVEISVVNRLRPGDGPVQIGMWIATFRSVDFVIGYEIRTRDGTLACTAETQMAVVDVENARLRRLTDEEKGYLRQWSRAT